MKNKLYLLSGTALLAAGFPAVAHAQGANSYDVNEIIVTAQKREEKLQDVPLAVTAVGADQIAERGLANITEVTRLAPNVNFNEGIVNPTLITPYIRGIGTHDNSPESDMPVAVSIDGVYLASVYGGLIDAFDIQQVEILRGPQGTLQGRNAPGGAVNITTRRPGDVWTVRGMAEYGKFSDVKLNVGVDGPLIEDKLGLKLAMLYRNANGYQKGMRWSGLRNADGTANTSQDTPSGDRFGGRDSLSFKAGLQITPSDTVNIWLSGDYTKDKSEPTAFRDVNDGKSYPRPEYADQLNSLACVLFGWCTPSKKYTTYQADFGNNKITNWGLTSNIDVDLGAATLTSVTGYRKIRDEYALDIDATPFPLLEARPGVNGDDPHVGQKTFSQEVRIASNDGGSMSMGDKLRWLIGGYYMKSNMVREQYLIVFGNNIGSDYRQKLKSYAIFGHVDVKLTDALTFGVGARESWDKKQFFVDMRGDTFVGESARKSWKKFMYDANVNYKFTPDVMGYVRYARGSRPGGFNHTPLSTYNPETVDSIEGGLKTQLLDRKVTFNVTGFYYKYKGIQRQTSTLFPDGTFARVNANAGKDRAYGLEVELSARPVEGLKLDVGLGYLNAKYKEWFDSEANPAYDPTLPDGPTNQPRLIIDNSTLPVQKSPKWTINLGASYDIPVSDSGPLAKITPSVNLYHVSSQYTNTEAQPASYDNAHSLLSAALRMEGPDNRYALTVFGDNLTNSYYIQNGGDLGGLSAYVQEGRPRTYGVRLEFKFQ